MKNKINELVNHPDHYQVDDKTYEPYKVIQAWGCNFNIGSALKYLARYQKKWNPIEDLKKAKQYIDFEIEYLTNKTPGKVLADAWLQSQDGTLSTGSENRPIVNLCDRNSNKEACCEDSKPVCEKKPEQPKSDITKKKDETSDENLSEILKKFDDAGVIMSDALKNIIGNDHSIIKSDDFIKLLDESIAKLKNELDADNTNTFNPKTPKAIKWW